MLLALVMSAPNDLRAAAKPDPVPLLSDSDVRAYIAYTPAIVRELRRPETSEERGCVPLARLEAAAAAVHFPGVYTDVSFAVWAAYQTVAADRAPGRARDAPVPPVAAADKALVARHVEQVGVLIASLEQALAELPCR